jgi:hypothetical protein
MPTTKPHSFITASVLGIMVAIPAFADTETTDDSPNTSWVGVITTDNTPVRCGANESYYPIAMAKTGDLVLVEGKKQDWMQIDTFGEVFNECVGYVKYPSQDTSVFIVAKNNGNAIGDIEVLAKNIESDELYRSWRPVLRLREGDTVKIISSETTEPGTLHREAYIVHTIKMPRGGTGWINASNIQRASKEQVGFFFGTPSVAIHETEKEKLIKTKAVVAIETIETGDSTSETTDSTVGIAQEEKTLESLTLVDLEAKWEVVTKEPDMGAELSPLRDMYTELLANSEGDLVVAQVTGVRIKQLNVWERLRERQLRIEQLRSDLGEQSGDVSEFKAVMEMNGEYAVIGKLALSNTFDGRLRPLMYRVQDQHSGRTLGYLPVSEDFELSALLGQRVGVSGKSTWNPTWRVRVIDGTRFDLLSPTTAIVTPDIQ